MRRFNRLSLYDFEIIYLKGCNNLNADGLSRLPIDEDKNENYIPEDDSHQSHLGNSNMRRYI
jgi:hypothetical protein